MWSCGARQQACLCPAFEGQVYFLLVLITLNGKINMFVFLLFQLVKIVPFAVDFDVLVYGRYKPEIGDIIIGRVIEVIDTLSCRHYEKMKTILTSDK